MSVSDENDKYDPISGYDCNPSYTSIDHILTFTNHWGTDGLQYNDANGVCPVQYNWRSAFTKNALSPLNEVEHVSIFVSLW